MNTKSNHRKSALPIWLICLIVAIVSIGLTLFFNGRFHNISNQEAQSKNNIYGEPVPKPTNLSNSQASEAQASGTQSANSQTTFDSGKKISWTQDKKFYFIDNWYMNTRINFLLDGVWHRMGNIGEILDTAKRIRHTSELSWYREWFKTAERVRKIGDNSLAKGHKISAGEAYLRASSYYLASEVFLHTNPDDPRILETYKKGGDYFLQGLRLLSEPVELVKIPYAGTTLRGYFFRSPLARGKAPLILVHQGFDAPVEQTKYIAEEANRRGYNCLLFEGPGQGLSIREKKIPFRPDWEKVVSAVVDYAISQPEVDRNNLILMGISLGGGLATRAVEYEHRIKICIVDPGYVNIYDVFRDILNNTLINLYEEDPKEFDKKVLELTKFDVGVRWGINHAVWVFGGTSPADMLTKLKQYNYEKDLKKITSQMLIMDGTGEEWGKGQAKKLYDSLTCPKFYMLFTEEDSASGHCQAGGPAISTQRLFDWLDEHIKN